MTDNDPYRAPDAVLKLEQQLHAKQAECEDLRREVSELEDELNRVEEVNESDRKNAREWWTWRLAWVLAAICVVLTIGAVWSCEMRPPPPEGACRDVSIKIGDFDEKCPYAGQVMTDVAGGRVKCTCPSPPVGAPASSQ